MMYKWNTSTVGWPYYSNTTLWWRCTNISRRRNNSDPGKYYCMYLVHISSNFTALAAWRNGRICTILQHYDSINTVLWLYHNKGCPSFLWRVVRPSLSVGSYGYGSEPMPTQSPCVRLSGTTVRSTIPKNGRWRFPKDGRMPYGMTFSAMVEKCAGLDSIVTSISISISISILTKKTVNFVAYTTCEYSHLGQRVPRTTSLSILLYGG